MVTRGCREGKMGRNWQMGTGLYFGNILEKPCENTKCHWIVHFKMVHFMWHRQKNFHCIILIFFFLRLSFLSGFGFIAKWRRRGFPWYLLARLSHTEPPPLSASATRWQHSLWSVNLHCDTSLSSKVRSLRERSLLVFGQMWWHVSIITVSCRAGALAYSLPP